VGRFGSHIALWLFSFGFAVCAGAAQPSIRFAEPVNVALKGGGVTEFDAYGRRFSLALVGNERVLQKLPVAHKNSLSSYRLWRGSVSGAPRSWVRLTESADGIEGVIWDGDELYAVTRYENIAALLTTPLAAAPKQTVVYRLSDAHDSLPADFCAAGMDGIAPEATALDQYKSLVGELQAGMPTPIFSRLKMAMPPRPCWRAST
jgi:hypothetical protein